jgi:phosphatidylethanolamine-binding protein (PEBP) family uncharacterized protein
MALCCLAALSACSSSDDPNPATGGATSVAGMSSGGNAGAGTSGSSAGGAATAGSATGGTPASAGSAGAGASAGGIGGSSAGGGGNAGGTAGTGGGGAGGASAGTGGGGSGGGGGASGFTLTSPGWTSPADCSAANKAVCGVFPKDNIGTSIGGSNKSPELDWGAGPSGTQSYAIVLHDLTNMMGGKPFVHWVMWNIPGATRMLPAGLETTAMPSVPAGSSQRAYTANGYQGSGKCGNVYEFVLYALPMATFTPSGTTQTSVADGLDATGAPTATLRARSGAPGCTE